MGSSAGSARIVDLVSLGLVIGGVGWIIYNIVAWRTASFAVTNLRVMHEEGLIQHRSSATMLTSVSDVRTDQSFIGKQLTYGDVVIYSQSGSAGVDKFRTIRAPMEFRNAIMAEKSATTTTTPVPAAPTPAAAAAPVPAQRDVAASATATSSADAAAALASLATLRDQGAITNEEFEAKKAELLARM